MLSVILKYIIALMVSLTPVFASEIQNIKVLALMVEFQEDDLAQTTGNGTFNSGYPDTLKIDGIPHDKAYFEDQLTFVKNYFESQSGGRVFFEDALVLDTVVTVPYPMWYYNPNNGGEILLQRLTQLYSDSWGQVTGITDIPFSDFNTFVIYHAGSGQEFSPGYDETPFDIPSVYLSPKDLTGQEVVAHDGTEIANTIILPECEWQIFDGNWYYAGMGGISCLMFAHRLGIPNLYSSADGSSGIGRFGLMDQGSANFSGMIPSAVSAWPKELMGWSDVRTLTVPEAGVISKADSTISRIDLNSDEYLLIENRTAKNPSLREGNSITGYDRDGRRIRFYYDQYGFQRTEILDEGFITLVRIDDNDFDFGIPARGILVWHIDKRKTTEYHIENNSVNNDPAHKGVYIEEADGSFDIGKDYWLLDNGYGTELGWEYDAFFAGNEIWLQYANRALTRVEFSSRSYPRSDTNEGIQTGLKLDNFSSPGREMYFSFSFEETGRYFSTDSGMKGSLYLPFYSISGDLMHFFAGRDGEYRVYDTDSLVFSDFLPYEYSEFFLPVKSGDFITVLSKDSTGVIVFDQNGIFKNRIEEPGVKFISKPADGIFPSDSGLFILNDDGTGIELIEGTEAYSGASGISVLRDSSGDIIFIAGINDGGTLFSADMREYPYLISESGIENDKNNSVFIITGPDMEQIRVYNHITHKDEETAVLTVNDLDSDGKAEIITSSANRLYVVNKSGILENGFPVTTGLGHILHAYVFGQGEDKFTAVVDSSSNYTVVSASGSYRRGHDSAMNGFSFNSGLLSSEGSVYLYSHSSSGILTYHRIGSGSIDDHLNMLNGVVIVQDDGAGSERSAVSGNVYNWPNPARGGETNFRFFLNRPCHVSIDIYDINGNRINSLSGSFEGSGEYYEIKWDVRSVPSGVFNAVLTFKHEGKEEKRLVKAAVIK